MFGSLLAAFPFEPPLFFGTVEAGLRRREVKHTVVAAVAVDVLDMAIMCRAGTTTGLDDVGGAEAVVDVLAGWIESLRLQDGDRDDAVAVRIDRIVLSPCGTISARPAVPAAVGSGIEHRWLLVTPLVESPCCTVPGGTAQPGFVAVHGRPDGAVQGGL